MYGAVPALQMVWTVLALLESHGEIRRITASLFRLPGPRWVKKVSSANMQPGDLIFYAGSNGKVNHVAIYIGNGRIVHAASRRSGIKTSTWNYRTPVAIRSMLD